ncbi:MAG: hypothetical protein UF234_05695, partial [Oscillospiraceae bacterium]|nr:hypothetical protein [Oscillospiraceae bacterium]
FLPQKGCGRKLFVPCVPPVRFPVWVKVWVNAAKSSGVGQLLAGRKSFHFALLETMKGYLAKSVEPPGGERLSRQTALYFRSRFPYGSRCGSSGNLCVKKTRTGFAVIVCFAVSRS